MIGVSTSAARRVAAVAVLASGLFAACGSSTSNRTALRTTAAPGATEPARIIPTQPTATTAAASSPATAPTAATACGFLRPANASYRHVVWIWMENHSYSSVIGSPRAPFENKLAGECGLATNYHNISHPSLPNYVAGTSGLPVGSLGQFASDCNPSSSCRAAASVPSIFSEVPSWKAYEESMPSACFRANAGEYAVRHNPPPYFSELTGTCPSNDVPFTGFGSDLAGGTLPAFSFITPNVINDTHDGSIADGDRWLTTTVSLIVGSSAYRSGTVALFITWDEGEGGSSNDCATDTTDVGCHVAAIVVAPSTTPGTRSGLLFNHYSLLRTAEDLLGVPPIGQAASATPMEQAFGL